jgi:hypothetical protein
MLLCRYTGPGLGEQFFGSSYVTRASVIAGLTREFNELPPLPTDRSSVKCPLEEGGRVTVVLDYPQRRQLRIYVTLSGCPVAVRAKTGRWALGPAGEPLIRQLRELTLASRLAALRSAR